MNHEHYLTQALELAQQRRGFCAPNPAVGAVVVKDDQILATGTHWAAGMPHAEVDALKKLQFKAPGATIYVTLEPCCHWGKTPPCTDQIIASGIKEVIYGYADSNPKVAGHSQQQLHQAGIRSSQLKLPKIDSFYKSYSYWREYQRPYVTAKLAMSLDGKIAAEEGRPVALTGEKLRELTHKARKRSDAILTTVKTILADNPLLNARCPEGVYNKPIVILDSHLQLPDHMQIWQSAANIILFFDATLVNDQHNKIANLNKLGAKCVPIDYQDNQLNWSQILNYLGEQGIQDLWVEAGGRCFESLLKGQWLNRALLYVAPKWLGATAQTAFTTPLQLLAGTKKMVWETAGEDVYLEVEW